MNRPSPDRRWDVLCIGDPCADLMIEVDGWPPLGGKCTGRPLGTQAGGTASNVACAVARLGGRAAALGPVGDDANGALLRASFDDFGVDCRYVTNVAGQASSSVAVMLAPGGERTIVYMPMRAPPLDAAALRAAIEAARAVYVMPYDLDELVRIAGIARGTGALVAIDLERAVASNSVEMHRRIAQADIVFFNEDGFVAATGQQPNAGTLAALLDEGPRVVVVTLGASGAMAADKTGFAMQPSFACPVVDTTGAGDSFNAAWLVAFLEGEPIDRALRFACAAASFAVGSVGARPGLPDREKVELRLQNGVTATR